MKKILFVVESLAGGGAEKVLLTLIKNLNKEKYDITVFTIVKTGVYVEEISKYCKLLYALDDYNNLSGIDKLLYRLKLKFIYKANSQLVYKTLIKEKYDIEVAFVEGFSTKLVSSSNNKLSKKYAWVHTNMNTNPHADIHYSNMLQQRECYKKLNKIFAVSQDVKDAFINKFNINENVYIQYNPVDSNEIKLKSLESQNDIEKDNLCFITIGRLEHQKGYDRLLKIVKKLKDENYKFKLYILGTGSLKDKFEKYIKDNQLFDYVKLLGFCANPYKYLKVADCFVCSSYTEGFSTVATESMILNIPIITTKCSGMEELFGDFKCGIITENDEESLYQGMKYVLDNLSVLEEYKSGIQIRKNDFDIAHRIREIEVLLDE